MLKVPLHLRQKLNRECPSLACTLDRGIKDKVGRYTHVTIIEVNTRYVKVMVDGVEIRVNYRTKDEVKSRYYKGLREDWSVINHDELPEPWNWEIK